MHVASATVGAALRLFENFTTVPPQVGEGMPSVERCGRAFPQVSDRRHKR